MERQLVFTNQKTAECEGDSTTRNDLQVQFLPYHNPNGIFNRDSKTHPQMLAELSACCPSSCLSCLCHRCLRDFLISCPSHENVTFSEQLPLTTLHLHHPLSIRFAFIALDVIRYAAHFALFSDFLSYIHISTGSTLMFEYGCILGAQKNVSHVQAHTPHQYVLDVGMNAKHTRK